MDAIAFQPKIATANLTMEQLASNTQLNEKEKVGELSRQFEAVLLRQILSEGQKTIFKSKYNQDTTTGGIYQDMITNQMADGISRSGSFGLAHSLERELGRQIFQKDAGTGAAVAAPSLGTIPSTKKHTHE
jgi:Rod binding domain-containing protein